MVKNDSHLKTSERRTEGNELLKNNSLLFSHLQLIALCSPLYLINVTVIFYRQLLPSASSGARLRGHGLREVFLPSSPHVRQTVILGAFNTEMYAKRNWWRGGRGKSAGPDRYFFPGQAPQ